MLQNCRNFNNTGMCVEVCPDVYIYDPVTMRQSWPKLTSLTIMESDLLKSNKLE